MPNFSLAGRVSATVRIQDKTYTLIADSEAGNSSRLRLRYHAPFEEAFVLGSMADVVGEIATVFNLGAQLDAAKWAQLSAQAKALPGFGPIFANVIDTNIRITDIVLELDAPDGTGASPPIGSGKAALGFVFDCATAPNNQILGITLESVGIMLSFSYGV